MCCNCESCGDKSEFCCDADDSFPGFHPWISIVSTEPVYNGGYPSFVLNSTPPEDGKTWTCML